MDIADTMPPQPGDALLIYSDGLSETIEASEPPIEVEDLSSVLIQQHAPSAQGLCDLLWRAAGGEGSENLIHDDFTVVAVRRQI